MVQKFYFWFKFYLLSCFKLIIMLNHTQKQRKIQYIYQGLNLTKKHSFLVHFVQLCIIVSIFITFVLRVMHVHCTRYGAVGGGGGGREVVPRSVSVRGLIQNPPPPVQGSNTYTGSNTCTRDFKQNHYGDLYYSSWK